MNAVSSFSDVLNFSSSDVVKGDYSSNIRVSNLCNRDFQDILDKSTNYGDQSQARVNKQTSQTNVEQVVDNFKKESAKPDNQNNQADSSNKNQAESVQKTNAEEKSTVDESKEPKQVELSEKDKAELEDLANKLGIDQKTLMGMLQLLNINMTNLSGNSTAGEVFQKIKDSLDKLGIKVNMVDVDGQQKIKFTFKSKTDGQKTDMTNQDINQEELLDKIKAQLKLKSSDYSNKPISLVANEKEDTSTTKTQIPVIQIKSTKKTDGLTVAGQKDENVDKIQGDKQNSKTSDQPPDMFKSIKVIKLKTSEQVKTQDNSTQEAFPLQNAKTTLDNLGISKSTTDISAGQKDSIFEQVVENAKLILSDKQGQMELNLKPESLGKLSMKIATENGMVTASIATESQKVKETIETNLVQLEKALKEQGLNIQEFNVYVGQDQRRETYNGNYSSEQKPSRSQTQNINTVHTSENYISGQMVKNPYLISQSSIDLTA